jgi:hypothetical protein
MNRQVPFTLALSALVALSWREIEFCRDVHLGLST